MHVDFAGMHMAFTGWVPSKSARFAVVEHSVFRGAYTEQSARGIGSIDISRCRPADFQIGLDIGCVAAFVVWFDMAGEIIMVIDMMIGAIVLASMLVALFFLRFWKNTGDRFFLYFALAFGVEGVNRLISGLTHTLYEDAPLYYLIRLVSYGLILVAIWEKNRPARERQ
jgi:hypothetical protein